MCVHLPKELINCFKTPKNTVGVKVSMNGVLKIFLIVMRKQESIQENKVEILFIVLDINNETDQNQKSPNDYWAIGYCTN